jgi:penicillin amidase
VLVNAAFSLGGRAMGARTASLLAIFLTFQPLGWTAIHLPDALQTQARAVLAQLEGEIVIQGLREPVEVLRDQWGVPHIYARNEDDLFFSQGFIAAQDRLFQMDLWRRVNVGETSELLGRRGLESDLVARLLRYRGDMKPEWSSYSPDGQRIATAFTKGINACIDRLGDQLPIEFQLLSARPKKWQPEDCLGRMSGIVMTRNLLNEVSRTELIQAVGVEKARRLAPTDPPRDFAPLLDLAGIDRTIVASFQKATRAVSFADPTPGSNNWVVNGKLSTTGKPLLASDPHRALTLPSLRYLVHLHAPGWHVLGAGEPGLPGVALGHNDRIAWGFTIVGTDQADLYVEETHPQDDQMYRVGDGWQRMSILREAVVVKGEAKPIEIELRFTRHGPVFHQDLKRHRAYALRWVGSEPGGAAYLGSLAINRAQNWQEFVLAMKGWKLPSENMVFADVDGNIGWIAAGLAPIRKSWDGLLPVPGNLGQHEWRGFVPVNEMPQAFNPPSSYIATANHNILPTGFPHTLSYEWALPYRMARVYSRLNARPKFTVEDFKSIQHDSVSIPGQRLARLAKLVAARDSNLRPYAELLASWDGELAVDSRAGALGGVWLQELSTAFFKPHVPENLLTFVRSGRGTHVLLAALEDPTPVWFGERPLSARDELLRASLAAAVKRLQTLLPGDSQSWTWGRLHRAHFQHPLATLRPEYARVFNLDPVPRPGDGHTPNAGTFNDRFQQTSGASYRHIFDLADWDRAVATSCPGQSGQPESPHYADLLDLWAEGRYFPLAFSRKKVEEVTRHRLLLQPGK